MTTYTFVADTSDQFVDWNTPSVWSGGVVPDSVDADVVIPEIIQLSSGSAYTYFLTIDAGASYTIDSLSIAANYLDLYGSLGVAGGFDLLPQSELDIMGGTLSIGSLQNTGIDIQGYGEIASAGSIVNQGMIDGTDGTGNVGLTLSFGAFDNTGLLFTSTGLTVDVTGGAGSFANFTAGALAGGTYEASDGGTLDLSTDGVIVSDAATIELAGNPQTAPGTIESVSSATGSYVPLESSLQSIAGSGVLWLLSQTYATGNTLTVDGTLTLSDAVFSASDLIIDATGTADGAGTLAGPIANSGVITAGPGNPASSSPIAAALVVQGPVAGTGSLAIAGAAFETSYNGSEIATLTLASTLELASTVSENVSFGNSAGTLLLDAPQSFSGTIVPAGDQDATVLVGISLGSITDVDYFGGSAGGTLILTQPGTITDLYFSGDYDTDSFTLTAGPQEFSTSPPSVIVTETAVSCFARGTRVATPGGAAAVEDLRIGDAVLTARGRVRPIRWIGWRSYAGRFVAANHHVLPVLIRAGALAANMPARDLFVSPNHAVLMAGLLIPAIALVNGASIVQLAAVERVEYFHIELASHDVILAEGAPVETFVDDGSRSMFHNAAEFAALYADGPPAPARYCASRVEDGEELEAVRRWLAGRAVQPIRSVV